MSIRVTYTEDQYKFWFDTKIGNFVVIADAIDEGKREVERTGKSVVVQYYEGPRDYRKICDILPEESIETKAVVRRYNA